jgi:hypothetical protein
VVGSDREDGEELEGRTAGEALAWIFPVGGKLRHVDGDGRRKATEA